jgi:hypothetical protein
MAPCSRRRRAPARHMRAQSLKRTFKRTHAVWNLGWNMGAVDNERCADERWRFRALLSAARASAHRVWRREPHPRAVEGADGRHAAGSPHRTDQRLPFALILDGGQRPLCGADGPRGTRRFFREAEGVSCVAAVALVERTWMTCSAGCERVKPSEGLVDEHVLDVTGSHKRRWPGWRRRRRYAPRRERHWRRQRPADCGSTGRVAC